MVVPDCFNTQTAITDGTLFLVAYITVEPSQPIACGLG